ncbi:MAG: FecR domain-containing protein [Halanaerobiales bacterium]
MKKKLFISALLIIICSAILIYSDSLMSGSVIISEMQGEVEIKNESSFLGIFKFGDWKSLSSDHELQEGDVIRTGDNGSIEIIFNENIYVKVDNNTEFAIGENQIRENNSNRTIKLNSGRVWAKVVRIYNEITNFEVITPGAVAGVRGTLFSIYTDGEETILSVKEGAVELSSSDRQSDQLVNKQEMGIASGGRVRLENNISEEENNRWKNRDMDDWMEKMKEVESNRGRGNNNGNGGNPHENGNPGNNNPGNGNPGNGNPGNDSSGNDNQDNNSPDNDEQNEDQGEDDQNGESPGSNNQGSESPGNSGNSGNAGNGNSGKGK